MPPPPSSRSKVYCPASAASSFSRRESMQIRLVRERGENNLWLHEPSQAHHFTAREDVGFHRFLEGVVGGESLDRQEAVEREDLEVITMLGTLRSSGTGVRLTGAAVVRSIDRSVGKCREARFEPRDRGPVSYTHLRAHET